MCEKNSKKVKLKDIRLEVSALMEHSLMEIVHEQPEPELAELAIIGRRLRKAAGNKDRTADDYDSLVHAASGYIERGEPMPYWLRDFSTKVLSGLISRPVKRGRQTGKNFERDYKLSRAVDYVYSKYNVPLYTNNELSKKISACDIVAEATGISVDIVKHSIRAHDLKGYWGKIKPI